MANTYSRKPLAIYCNPDHTHILVGLHTTLSVSDLVNKIKANSSGFYHKIWKVINFSFSSRNSVVICGINRVFASCNR
ncbi:MAG: transposase [Dysgonamonadaceae bacterium]|nr:transposase [Dysgonamonadaceae bacterium]